MLEALSEAIALIFTQFAEWGATQVSEQHCREMLFCMAPVKKQREMIDRFQHD